MSVAESRIRQIIDHPFDYNGWTVQGLGMLRLDIDKTRRLHIWDPAKALNSVVSAHDHPWDLNSTIYWGKQGNQRYELSDEGAIPVQVSRVACGVGSHLVGVTTKLVMAEASPSEVYKSGQRYTMRAEELHDSLPEPGTVTVIDRTWRDDREAVTICWTGDGDWKQEGFTHPAKPDEIVHYVDLAKLCMKGLP